MATGAIFIFLRRRKRPIEKSEPEESPGIEIDGKARGEMGSQQIRRKKVATGGERHELNENHGMGEVVGDQSQPHEMAA